MSRRQVFALSAVLMATTVISAVAACSGPTTSDIVRTSEAENKIENATATSAAVATAIAKGDKPRTGGEGDVTGGQGGVAGGLRATAAAEATATAGAGGSQSSALATATPSAADVLEAPPGDPLTGQATVKIVSRGEMDPAVLKVKVGTTVTWENAERSNHSSVSDPGQAEDWNSGEMARRIGETENRKFSYTFTKPGRYTYRSDVPTDPALQAVVFVVP